MPDTMEELESAIQDTQSEANYMMFLNHNSLQEYQNRQREIELISNKLEEHKGERERCCSDIEITKGKWLPTMRTLVSKVNDTFSRNFEEMAIAGEVSLGMDPINERKMFQQLVRAASQPNTPQCFLLTPKLLSDLE